MFAYKYEIRYYSQMLIQSSMVQRRVARRPDAQSISVDSDMALRHIQSEARYFFEPDEFARRTGREPGSAAVKSALQRLARARRIALATKRPPGWLIVPAEHAHYGAPPVLWWLDDCLKRIEPDYYLALLSAARHWGSAHYAKQDVQVMVGKPRRALAPGRLSIIFFAKQGIRETPTLVVKSDVANWRVSTREATLLDLIRHQSAIGGLESVTRVVRDFSPALQVSALATALDALGQTPAAQRLGFLLDRLGSRALAAKTESWLAPRKTLRHHLEPHVNIGRRTLEFDERWRLVYAPSRLSFLQELV